MLVMPGSDPPTSRRLLGGLPLFDELGLSFNGANGGYDGGYDGAFQAGPFWGSSPAVDPAAGAPESLSGFVIIISLGAPSPCRALLLVGAPESLVGLCC